MRADGLWPRPRRVQTPDGGPLVVGAGARFAIEAKPDPGRPGEQSAAEEIAFAAYTNHPRVNMDAFDTGSSAAIHCGGSHGNSASRSQACASGTSFHGMNF